MKPEIPKRALVLLLYLLAAGPASRAGEGGGQGTGNGGDSIAMEFYAIGTVVVNALRTDAATAAKFPEVKPDALAKATEETVVRGTDDVLRDQLGNEKNAINYREDGKAWIKVRRKEYNGLPTLLRQRLVFHEYLGVLGLEKSDDYRISNRLDTVLSRPMFGLCVAEKKREVCSVGFRFDPATRSLDGAYRCTKYARREKDTSVMAGIALIGRPLASGKAEWRSVRIWPDKWSYSAGFGYVDEWVKFEVPSSPVSGMRLPFKLKERRVRFDRPDEEVELSGSCVLLYD